MNKRTKAFQWTLTSVFLGFFGMAQASIALNATRVIFNNGAKDASIVVRNNSDSASLIQTWIESNTPNDEGDLPFAVTPPVAQIEAKGQQFTRVIYSGGNSGLPSDRESVFWLNVQEIPQASENENTLQVAVRQRVKVFYRPKGLPGSAADAPKNLKWRISGDNGSEVLEVENPTAFTVSTAQISFGVGNEVEVLEKGKMIAPYDKVMIPFSKKKQKSNIEFNVINDYGAVIKYKLETNGSNIVSATQIEK